MIRIFFLLALGLLSGSFIWDHYIRNLVEVYFNNIQLTQVIQSQKDFINEMKTITADQQTIFGDLVDKNDKVVTQFDDFNNFLNSPQAIKDDRSSSNVLKKAIDAIRNAEKQK